jgi:hypothetical protein
MRAKWQQGRHAAMSGVTPGAKRLPSDAYAIRSQILLIPEWTPPTIPALASVT